MTRLPRWFPILLAFLVPLGVISALCWPLPLHLNDHFHPSIFGPSHAWTADHLWQVLAQGEPLSPTHRAGYPWPRDARFIGWLPLLAMLPARLVLGPITTFHLAELLALPCSAIASWPLIRRWTDAGPWTTAAACISFALCPLALGVFSTGELPKLAIGLIPLFLWSLDRGTSPDENPGWLALPALLALLTAFTSPYYGLALPLLTGGLLAVRVWRSRTLLRPFVGGLVVAAALLPAWWYYGASAAHTNLELFMPARSGGIHPELPQPHPVASLQDLLLGLPAPVDSPWTTRHVAYVGSALLLALLVHALWKRRPQRGRKAAFALLIVGAVLAMGPWLYLNETFIPFPLPAWLLGRFGYPLGDGGMYYRMAVLASLGLALWLAAELAQRPRLAWILLATQLCDAARSSGPWPLEVEPIPAASLMKEIRGRDGAVVNLPFGQDLIPAQRQLLLAAVHGRPTTALPRTMLHAERRRSAGLWEQAFRSDDPAQALRDVGVRWVMAHGDPRAFGIHVAARLGEPWESSGGLQLWDLGPTQVEPHDPAELITPTKPPKNTLRRGGPSHRGAGPVRQGPHHSEPHAPPGER